MRSIVIVIFPFIQQIDNTIYKNVKIDKRNDNHIVSLAPSDLPYMIITRIDRSLYLKMYSSLNLLSRNTFIGYHSHRDTQ